MAIYRNVALTFWTDIKVVDDFTPEDKYFMMYCLTNPHTNIIGCYEISLKQMSTEMGYTVESVQAILKRFNEKHQTILYDEETKELYIKNWYKYNWTSSTKILQPIISCYNQIKSNKFKCLVGEKVNEIYGMDTVSVPYRYRTDTTVSDTVSDTVSVSDFKKEGKEQTDYGKQKTTSKRKKEEPKHKYGEYQNVLLTDKEYETLINDYPNSLELITYLDEYIEMKGYKAKSHYLAIRKWVVNAVEERKSKRNNTYEQKSTLTRLQEMIAREEGGIGNEQS